MPSFVVGAGNTTVSQASFYNTTTKGLSGACVTVLGTLKINENYNFQRVKFIMGANSKIAVAIQPMANNTKGVFYDSFHWSVLIYIRHFLLGFRQNHDEWH